MQTPDSSTWPMPVAIAVLTAVLFLLSPLVAAGQWAPVDTASVELETPTLSSDLLWEPAPLPLGVPLSTLTLSSSSHNPLLGSEEESLRKRLLPYTVVGAVIGGVIGYAVREPCDGDSNPFCPIAPYLYVSMGTGAGSLIGTLIGYFLERR